MTAIQILQVSSSTSEVFADNHRLLIDNDLAHGGNNNGANGSQLFLMSVGGDLMNHLLGFINQENAAISQVRLEVVGNMDETQRKFIDIKLNLTAQYSDKTQFKQLISLAERKSAVLSSVADLISIHICVS